MSEQIPTIGILTAPDGSEYMVDLRVEHDAGDEDDGLAKLLDQVIRWNQRVEAFVSTSRCITCGSTNCLYMMCLWTKYD